MESVIKQASSWIEEQITHLLFGEINIRFIIHEGKIKRIERTITEKVQK